MSDLSVRPHLPPETGKKERGYHDIEKIVMCQGRRGLKWVFSDCNKTSLGCRLMSFVKEREKYMTKETLVHRNVWQNTGNSCHTRRVCFISRKTNLTLITDNRCCLVSFITTKDRRNKSIESTTEVFLGKRIIHAVKGSQGRLKKSRSELSWRSSWRKHKTQKEDERGWQI